MLFKNNIRLTCRYFGISRNTFCKWYRQYEKDGILGLCDRPRKPAVFPRATPKDTISKNLYAKQHYHFGAGRIAFYLHRFHKIKIAPSTVHKILIQHNLSRLPKNQKKYRTKKNWKRYEKQKPGHALQVDVKVANR
ncbi:MAG: leucine zipper domain-containing protein [Bdellovibrionales bacterium]|nr:leucine zipper domain-containing protein [Bdellovibrionales bacterium]